MNTSVRQLTQLKIPTMLAAGAALGILMAGFRWWPMSPTVLSKAAQRETVEFATHWKAGDVVVLVRHAERCDRSSNPCLGPADGITQSGHDEAVRVGSQFVGLGMAQTDVISSPLTRTAQTAQTMFGVAIKQQDWLMNCNVDMSRDIKAHKLPGRNLVLVTHSGCISQFDTQLGYPRAHTADYTSAVITTLGPDGRIKMLGVINPGNWPQLALAEKAR